MKRYRMFLNFNNLMKQFSYPCKPTNNDKVYLNTTGPTSSSGAFHVKETASLSSASVCVSADSLQRNHEDDASAASFPTVLGVDDPSSGVGAFIAMMRNPLNVVLPDMLFSITENRKDRCV